MANGRQTSFLTEVKNLAARTKENATRMRAGSSSVRGTPHTPSARRMVNHASRGPVAFARWATRAPVVIILGLLCASPVPAHGMASPRLGCRIVLQLEAFRREDESVLGPSTGQVDRIAVREAVIELSGQLGPRLEYCLEAGAAQCPAGGGGGPEVALMDAAIFYRLASGLRVGMLNGHILKGFMLHEECTDGLAAEKARFAPVFSPCHPSAMVAEFEIGLGQGFALAGQASYLNGTNLTLEDEHDANLGLVLHTPVENLCLGGFYNDTRTNLGIFDPETYEKVYGDGYRAGLGFDFAHAGITLRSEYYLGRTFKQGAGGAPVIENPEDRQMSAFYAQMSYAASTGLAALPRAEPYVRFQHWDKAADLEDGHRWVFWTVGAMLHLSEDSAVLRLEYEAPGSRPSDTSRPADRLILRLQVSA